MPYPPEIVQPAREELTRAGFTPLLTAGEVEAELAGALASLLARLSHWREVLSEPATPTDWAERGRALMADMAAA